MTQKQKKAVIMLKEAIKKFEGYENVYLATEDAISLKRAIENQEGYIKELLEERNLMVEQILDKVRYISTVEDNRFILYKDVLDRFERQLKGEE